MTAHLFDRWRGWLPAGAALLVLGCGASASSGSEIAARGDRDEARADEESTSGRADDDSTTPAEDDSPQSSSGAGDVESASGVTPNEPAGDSPESTNDGLEEVNNPEGALDVANPGAPPNGASTNEPSEDDPPGPVPTPDFTPQETCVAPAPATNAELSERLQRLIWGADEEFVDPIALVEDLAPDAPASAIIVRDVAARMLADESKGRVGLKRFVHAWLQLDPERLSMDDTLLQSTLESTERTLDWLLFEPGETLSALYSGDQAVVNAELAMFYGVPAPDDEWGVVRLPEPRQAGLLGQAFWLNANHHPSTRGTVVMRSLRCATVPGKPPGLDEPPREESPSDMSRREQYLAALTEPQCAGCHALFDPVGLPFEHFDAWGEYRTTDNGVDVDATGGIGIPGTTLEVDGAAELAAVFAGELREKTHACIALSATAYALGLDSLPADPFDDPECYAVLNPELAALKDPLISDWILELVASPLFLAGY